MEITVKIKDTHFNLLNRICEDPEVAIQRIVTNSLKRNLIDTIRQRLTYTGNWRKTLQRKWCP